MLYYIPQNPTLFFKNAPAVGPGSARGRPRAPALVEFEFGGVGLRAWGSGFGVWGLFGVQGSGLKALGLGVEGLGFRV